METLASDAQQAFQSVKEPEPRKLAAAIPYVGPVVASMIALMIEATKETATEWIKAQGEALAKAAIPDPATGQPSPPPSPPGSLWWYEHGYWFVVGACVVGLVLMAIHHAAQIRAWRLALQAANDKARLAHNDREAYATPLRREITQLRGDHERRFSECGLTLSRCIQDGEFRWRRGSDALSLREWIEYSSRAGGAFLTGEAQKRWRGVCAVEWSQVPKDGNTDHFQYPIVRMREFGAKLTKEDVV